MTEEPNVRTHDDKGKEEEGGKANKEEKEDNRPKFAIQENGTLVLILPLAFNSKVVCRGMLLEADDMICKWFAMHAEELAKANRKLILPNRMANMRRGLKKIIMGK